MPETNKEDRMAVTDRNETATDTDVEIEEGDAQAFDDSDPGATDMGPYQPSGMGSRNSVGAGYGTGGGAGMNVGPSETADTDIEK